MLDADEIELQVRDLWARHVDELPRLTKIFNYATGVWGVPDVPEGASREIKDLARLAVKNCLSLVEDAFGQNLAVVGYRTAAASVNAPGWARWQTQGMDARQAEVNRAAIRYGAAYLVIAPESAGGRVTWRPRTPRKMVAIYADPQMDLWPIRALETWTDTTDARSRRKGLMIDDEMCYPLNLGEASKWSGSSTSRRVPVALDGDPWAHGATGDDGESVCPVIRYVTTRRGEDAVVGEVEPLIIEQQAINAVNFDRLVVSRFGAFPQRYAIGWSADDLTVLRAAMSRVWAFDDETVKVGAFPAASVEPYNSILTEMQEHLAMRAQVNPAAITGKLVNLSADALAAAEKGQQRKLAEMRLSLGESYEQSLRLDARMDGDSETSSDRSAEAVWADTEARAFGAVVDGITKLAAVGVPIDELLTLVSALSQQQITAIRDRMAGQGEILAALRQMSEAQQTRVMGEAEVAV